MELPFLNRVEELRRLAHFSQRSEGSLAVLYGRRRCGKSRLLLEALPPERLVYHLADEREPALQRSALASALGRVLPEFARVFYPDWESLLVRWWSDAPPGSILALDEFPALVVGARELPSLLQRQLDQRPRAHCHLVLCGSSQRLMQGLALDRRAPLFGRAVELLKIRPLQPGWVRAALDIADGVSAVEAFAVWGGIPRYWELAREFRDLESAITALVLDPLGILHEEPDTLLQDDSRDATQASSILQVVGQGCHRLSEVASRLGKPSGSLVRPVQRLLELDLLVRDYPFGCNERDSKRTLYRVGDPFLNFWYRFVAPHRSWLGERLIQQVWGRVQRDFAGYVGAVWETLARASVPYLRLFGQEWSPARRWWGPGLDNKPLEIDLVASTLDGSGLLLGSVKWEERSDLGRWASELARQARCFPLAQGKTVYLAVWSKRPEKERTDLALLGPDQVLEALT